MARSQLQIQNLKRAIFICLLLALATLAVYWPVGRCEFISCDDPAYVTFNPPVRGGLTWSGVAWAFTTTHTGNWHPVTWLSHMLDCQIYGLNPAGHHLTNLLFHLANTLLLFLVFKRMTGAWWRSAFVAALFALHPLHVESVAWVSERKDVLSTFFFMLTLWAYVRYVGESKVQSPKSRVFYALSLAVFGLGLMSKPMLVTLPFVLLLLDYWPLRRFELSTLNPQPSTLPRLLWEKLPFFILTIASSAVTFWVQKTGGSFRPTTFPFRIANAATSYVGYVGKMFWPDNLAVFYPYPTAFPKWQVMGAVLLLVVTTFCAIALRRRRPYWPVGWFWYLGTLVPVIGLVQVGGQAMADRYTYIPLIGLFAVIVWTLADLAGSNRHRRAALAAVGTVVLAACGWATFEQAGHWQNSTRLFQHALAVAPPSAMAHVNLGVTAMNDRHNFAEAKVCFETALQLRPDDPVARANLGIILNRDGMFDEAILHFAEAVKYVATQATAHHGWGLALLRQGRPGEAIPHFLAALRADRFYADAHVSLGNAWSDLKKTHEARAEYQAALRLDSNHDQAHYQLAVILVASRDVAEGTKHYREAVRLSPDGVPALNNLAWLLATQPDARYRDGNQAVALATRAVALTRTNDPAALDTLAAACAESGRYPGAVATARQAIRLAESSGARMLASEIETRLRLYEQSQPFHEPARELHRLPSDK